MSTRNIPFPSDKDFDWSVNPADDFFAFATNVWIKNNPIPETEGRWGVFDLLRKQNRKSLKAIVEALEKKKTLSADEKRVCNYYRAGFRTTDINQDGKRALAEYFKEIDALTDSESLMRYVGQMHIYGIDAFWHLFIEPDLKNTDAYIPYFYQGGLGLPDRDYYLKKDAHHKRLQKAYCTYMKNIFSLAGFSPAQARKAQQTVWALENDLAKHSMTRVDQRDPEKIYHKKSFQALCRHASHIPWKSYFHVVGVPTKGNLVVSQPKFITAVERVLKKYSLEEVKMYLTWCFLNDLTTHLGTAFEKESFAFYGTKLMGLRKQRVLWERRLGETESALPDILGRLYVKEHFSQKAKRQVGKMVDDITVAYRNRIKELSWMTPQTKKRALTKLSTVVKKIGYPDKWKSYTGLVIGESYLHNYLAVNEFEHWRTVRRLGKKVDREEWFAPASMVNAFYSPDFNHITFPAGILQPPFFYPDAPAAYNYGAIGSIIGHELTHGFDDEGSKFDEKGNLKNWWSTKDRTEFDQRGKKLVRQFNACTLFGQQINGKLTLGENIADLGGIIIAFEAYQRARKRLTSPPGHGSFTDEQLFFIGLTRFECDHARKELALHLLAIDPHSPARFRVNVPLSNFDEFYRVWDVKRGDGMYRPPRSRVRIW